MGLGAGGLGDVGGGVGGAIGGIIGMATAGSSGKKYLEEALRIMQKLKASDFDFRALSAPELQVLAKYSPSTYNAVVPDEVKQAMDSQAGHGAQLRGISYMEGIRDKGLPVETRLATEEAQRGIADQGQRNQDAILQGMESRGRLGGGSELAARIGGNQQAMDLAGQQSSDLVRQDLQRRMEAAGSAAGIGGAERAGTMGLSQFNADAANRFNQWVSDSRNQAAAENARATGAANAGNVENINRVGDANAVATYNTDLQNLNRQNALKGANFGQNLQIAKGQADILGQLADETDAERAARIRNAQNIGQGVGSAAGGAYGL